MGRRHEHQRNLPKSPGKAVNVHGQMVESSHTGRNAVDFARIIYEYILLKYIHLFYIEVFC